MLNANFLFLLYFCVTYEILVAFKKVMRKIIKDAPYYMIINLFLLIALYDFFFNFLNQ